MLYQKNSWRHLTRSISVLKLIYIWNISIFCMKKKKCVFEDIDYPSHVWSPYDDCTFQTLRSWSRLYEAVRIKYQNIYQKIWDKTTIVYIIYQRCTRITYVFCASYNMSMSIVYLEPVVLSGEIWPSIRSGARAKNAKVEGWQKIRKFHHLNMCFLYSQVAWKCLSPL